MYVPTRVYLKGYPESFGPVLDFGRQNSTLQAELGDLLPDFTAEEWAIVKGSSDL
jgi:hypothetical protein